MKSTVPILVACAFALNVASGCGGDGSASSTQTSTRAEAMGGEERIERFGSEAVGAERVALLGAFHAYLSGIASKNYGAACAKLAPEVQRSLEELASPRPRSVSCSAALPQLLATGAGAVAQAQVSGTVRKVRVEGDRAFIVFHAPGARLFQMPMTRMDDEWRIGLVAASILVPSAAMLGQ